MVDRLSIDGQQIDRFPFLGDHSGKNSLLFINILLIFFLLLETEEQ